MSIKVTPSPAWCAVVCGWALAASAQTVPATGITPPARLVPSGAQAISLAQALAAAQDNLDVQLARRGLAAARADIRAADHAPLPVVSAKASQMDLQRGIGPGNVLTQKRIDKGLGLDWTWERGDKRVLRTAAAQAFANAAAADLDDIRVQQLLAAWGAYYDLLAAQQRVDEVAAISSSAAELARANARREQAGDLSAQDSARTDIEAQRARADLTAAQLDAQRAAGLLAQLLRGPGADVPPIAPPVSPSHPPVATLRAQPSDWPALSATAAALDEASLQALIDQRADVRAASERAQAARAQLDAARALKKSDITVGTSVDHYPGTSTRLVELRASMPIQWGYGYEGEIGRAQALADQALDGLDKTRLLAQLDMRRLRQELAAAQQRLAAYEQDIVPRARRVAAGAELAYSKGASPLTDLLDARRTLRATLLEHLAARADHAKALGAWQLRTQPGRLPGAAASPDPSP